MALSLVLAIVLAACSCLVVIIIRRHRALAAHPTLAPFASVTNLAYRRHNALLPTATTRTEALRAAHARQPTIRLGPARLSFASAAAIKGIYGTGTKT